jgi:hypothetical protein
MFAISAIFSFCNRPEQISHRTILTTHHKRQPSPAGALLYIKEIKMSELTLTEPEVLTGHTDVICSTSIERIITGRNFAMQIETLIQQLDDISTLTRSIGGGKANEWECGNTATAAG